jgi:DNA-binding CsgD family transcriptional regulator
MDTLTPREREVLALIRLGLTNEEIAARLNITLDGAKYHVSQILSKLGVATREEAAAIAPEPRRRWWAALPLAAKAAGAALVVAAVAGLAVLAWGVVQTSDKRSSEDSLSIQPPVRELPDNLPGPTDAFCIEAIDVDDSYREVMKYAIEGTIADLERIGGFWDGAYANTVIDFGCPYPPINHAEQPTGRIVEAVGHYDAYIYILPRDILNDYFGSDYSDKLPRDIGVRHAEVYLTAEETRRTGVDTSVQSAYGLYLSPEVLSDQDLIQNDLCWAIGAGMPEYTNWPPNICNGYRTAPTP